MFSKCYLRYESVLYMYCTYCKINWTFSYQKGNFFASTATQHVDDYQMQNRFTLEIFTRIKQKSKKDLHKITKHRKKWQINPFIVLINTNNMKKKLFLVTLPDIKKSAVNAHFRVFTHQLLQQLNISNPVRRLQQQQPTCLTKETEALAIQTTSVGILLHM